MPEVKKIFVSRPVVTKPRQYLLDKNWRRIVSVRDRAQGLAKGPICLRSE